MAATVKVRERRDVEDLIRWAMIDNGLGGQLVERRGKHTGQWLGKSPWLQSVHFTGEAAIGDLVEVELVEAGPNSLGARLIG